MSKHSSSADSGQFAGLRKRIPLELEADDLARLQTLQSRYGSMRATLLAGLVALADADTSAASRDSAAADLAAAVKRAAAAEQELARLRAEAKREGTAAAKQSKRASETQSSLKQQVSEVRRERNLFERQLNDLRSEFDELESELGATAEHAVHAIRCARCRKLVSPDGWAEHPAKTGGTLVYHEACGLHEEAVLSVSSILGWRRD